MPPEQEAVKDTDCIPKGLYCYDEKGVCPYWKRRDDLPKQYNGYCAFLEKSDVEIAQERELEDCRTGERVRLPFPVSLLWDKCKECGINTLED